MESDSRVDTEFSSHYDTLSFLEKLIGYWAVFSEIAICRRVERSLWCKCGLSREMVFCWNWLAVYMYAHKILFACIHCDDVSIRHEYARYVHVTLYAVFFMPIEHVIIWCCLSVCLSVYHKGQIWFPEHNSKSFRPVNLKLGTETWSRVSQVVNWFGGSHIEFWVTEYTASPPVRQDDFGICNGHLEFSPFILYFLSEAIGIIALILFYK